MHKTRYNAMRLTLNLKPRGPLLIKSGGHSPNPALPDMQFVRTFHARLGETLYIPGSSIKGVVRGFVEKILRTLDANPDLPGPENHKDWQWACATFEVKDSEKEDRTEDKTRWNCPKFLSNLQGKQDRKELKSDEIYRHSCGACRTFGHTQLKGRTAFTDLYPVDEVKTEIRYGVAISRLSHAVVHGPFDMEVAVSGIFEGQLVMENYELWQVGLVVSALEGMNQGLVKVGFGKNRGFGEVEVHVKETVVDELSRDVDLRVWRGIGAFVNDEQRQHYGLSSHDRIEGMPDPGDTEHRAFMIRRRYDSVRWIEIVDRLMNFMNTR